MKQKKILYVASLVKKRNPKRDGETTKSQYIYECLSSHYDLTVVDLSKNRFFQVIYLFFLLMFNRYDKYVVSKSCYGAIKILRIFHFFKVKKTNVIYLIIGAYLPNLLRKNPKYIKYVTDLNTIIAETSYLRKSLQELKINNVETYPNFKPCFEITNNSKTYPKDVLSLIFFSRIEQGKGIYDLIDVINEINEDKVRFTLDIYGDFDSSIDQEKINLKIKKENINYYKALTVKSKEDYELLSKYDLHVFPTKHITEGVPGSIIDFFIAGVTSISSKYPNYKDLLDDECAFLYQFLDKQALKDTLMYAYNHQEEIERKNIVCAQKKGKYDIKKFEQYIVQKIEGDAND